jgi:hypothetical protein
MLSLRPAAAAACWRQEQDTATQEDTGAGHAYAPRNEAPVQVLSLVIERCVLHDKLALFFHGVELAATEGVDEGVDEGEDATPDDEGEAVAAKDGGAIAPALPVQATATMHRFRPFARLAASCKELRDALDGSAVWPLLCRVRVCNQRALRPGFSTFLLARQLHAAQAHAHTMRGILLGLGANPEQAAAASLKKQVADLHVCEGGVDEVQFWRKRFDATLRTSAVPTAAQWEEMRAAFAALRGLAAPAAAAAGSSSAPGGAESPLATTEEMVGMACGEGTNGILRAAAFALLADPALADPAPPPPPPPPAVDADAVAAAAAAAADGERQRCARRRRTLAAQELEAAGGHRMLLAGSGSVGTMLAAVGFLHGLSVDDVMAEKWELGQPPPPPPQGATTGTSPPSRQNFSSGPVRRVLLDVLAGCSWLQLYDLGKTKGLWKALSRSMHLYSLVLKQAGKAETLEAAADEGTEEGRGAAGREGGTSPVLAHPAAAYRKVGLFLLALRGARYPESAEAFARCQWVRAVVHPLRAMCSHPLFIAHDEAWLLPGGFQPSLAGRRLRLPLRHSVEATLSRDGNSLETWARLFEGSGGGLSAAQVLANVRSLALLGFPVEKVEAAMTSTERSPSSSDPLCRSEVATTLTLPDLLKLRAVLTSGVLAAGRVEDLFGRWQQAHGGDADSSATAAAQPPPPPAYVRVEGIRMDVRDKRGQASTQLKTKNIGSDFGAASLLGYQQMGQRLLAAHLDAREPSPGQEENVAAVVLSHELRDNLVRTGMPPRTPDYAPASLWRGETLCLQRMAALAPRALSQSPGCDAGTTPAPEPEAAVAEEGEPPQSQLLGELIVGITWCEQPQGGERVDLDLSVICFDASWERLCHCSYTQTTAPGMRHSGDLTSAPYPEGAREDVRLTLEELPPTTAYVALVVYNYTGQPMENCCHDASVFVATALPGLGPGGLDIISSAALKGKGKNVLGGLLLMGCGGRRPVERFMCCDQQLLSQRGVNVEQSSDQVAQTAAVVIEGASGLEGIAIGPPSKARLTEVAGYACALVANTVLIEHGAGGGAGDTEGRGADCCVSVLRRGMEELRSEFAFRICAQLASLEPVTAPQYQFGAALARTSSLGPGATTAVQQLVMFGGELEAKDASRALEALEANWRVAGGARGVARPSLVLPTLLIVNCRSNQELVERRVVERHAPYWAVSTGGVDAAASVSRALEAVRKERADVRGGGGDASCSRPV